MSDLENDSSNRVVESIQALRGIAALAVVLFHLKGLLIVDGREVGAELFWRGFIGVDVFFVISGFIMAYAVEPDERPAAFLLKRFLRVWPLYVLATAILLSISTAIDIEFIKQMAKAALFYPLANSESPFYGYAPLSVGWTLTYEALFYAVFALALPFRRARLIVAAAIIFTLVFVGQYVATGSITLSAGDSPILAHQYLSLAVNPILLEFVAGMAIAAIYQRLKLTGAALFLVGCVLATIAVYLFWFDGRNFHGPTQLGPSAVAVVSACLCFERQFRKRWASPLRKLGDMSYSLYLVHVSVIYLAQVTAVNSNSGWLAFMLNLALCVIFGHLFHKHVEIRILTGVRNGISAAKSRLNSSRLFRDF